MNGVYSLVKNTRVRKESWGLLFYSLAQHRMFFVRSGKWLYPHDFDGSWTSEHFISEVACRGGTSAEVIEQSIQGLFDDLTKNGVIINELC